VCLFVFVFTKECHKMVLNEDDDGLKSTRSANFKYIFIYIYIYIYIEREREREKERERHLYLLM